MVVAIHAELFKDIGGFWYTIVDYISRFAVSFFFIISGFFFERKLEECDTIEEVKEYIKKYFLSLLRPFIIWGTMYSIISLVGDVIIESKNIALSIVRKLYEIVTESPGGGLWYVYTLMWILVLMYVFYRKKSDIKIFILIFFGTYIISAVWRNSYFDNHLLGKLRDMYDVVFSSERIFIFRGVFFFVGMHMAIIIRKLKFHVKELVIVQIILYLVYVVLEPYSGTKIGCAVLLRLVSILIPMVYFLLAYNIPEQLIKNDFIKYNARKMSTVIYFTHFMVIYVFRFLFILLQIQYDTCLTFLCVLCWIILLIYSIFLIRLDKSKKIMRVLY